MAFTVTARHTANNGATGSQTITTSSATPTANSLLLAFYGTENNGHATYADMPAPSGGGLTFTLQERIGHQAPAIPWTTSTDYRLAFACYSAPVGASPAAHTLTVDPYTGTQTAIIAVAAVDITGHNAAAPVVQKKVVGVSVNPASDTAAGTLTLTSAPTAGNLLVVGIYSGADTGGTITSPTAGAGKTMTQHLNPGGSGWSIIGVWSRVCDGTESATITTADLGQQVGAYSIVALEVAPAGGGGSTTYAVAGTAAASSTTSAAATRLARTFTVSGTIAATSATTGDASRVARTFTVSGTVAASSAATADATRVPVVQQASGTTTATSSSTADATRVAAVLSVSGTITATTTTTGSVTGILGVTGSTPATSGTTGAVSVLGGPQTYPVTGTVTVTTGTTSAVTARLGVSGATGTASGTSGDATVHRAPVTYNVTGTIAATSSTSGAVTVVGVIEAEPVPNPGLELTIPQARLNIAVDSTLTLTGHAVLTLTVPDPRLEVT